MIAWMLLAGLIGEKPEPPKYHWVRYQDEVVWDTCDLWETPVIAINCPRNYSLKLPTYYRYRYYQSPFIDTGYWYTYPDKKWKNYLHGHDGQGWISTPRMMRGKVVWPSRHKRYLKDDRR